MTTGNSFSVARSISRVSFSPTTDPIEPPIKPNSMTRQCGVLLPDFAEAGDHGVLQQRRLAVPLQLGFV